jgi:transaldolase
MRDVTTACDLLRPVWKRTEAGDGYVSIEVDPNLGDDTEATIAQRRISTRQSRARTCWSRSRPPMPACRRSKK